MSHRERWLSEVCDLRSDGKPVALPNGADRGGAPRQPGSFRLVMALLSMYADNDSGANARPSLRLLQAMSHYKHGAVRAALDAAEAAGYIAATGTWTPPKGGDPITVWSLGYPTSEGFQPWDANNSVTPLGGTTDSLSVTPLDGTTDGGTAGRDHRLSVGDPAGRDHRDHRGDHVGGTAGRNVGGTAGRNVGGPAGRHTTSSTSRPMGVRDDEDESAHAPAPDGAALTRLEASVFNALAERWSDDPPVVSRRSRRLLGDLLNAGWPEAAIRAGVATIGKSPRNPALLLEKHLRRLLDEHEPRDFGNLHSGDARALADSDPAAMVKAAPEVADPLAEVNQRALANFCKYAGADVKLLRQACIDLTRQGFTIEANLRGGDLADHPALHVIHPYDTDDLWMVSWQVGREPGEPPYNSLHMYRNDGESVEGKPSVAGLRRLVAQTWPEAKAAIDEYRATVATEPTAQQEGVSE